MTDPANTLDDFPAERFTILAFCDACGHHAPVDRTRVAAGMTLPQVRSQLRCSVCTGRACSIRILYTAAGGFR